jgi:nucleoporin POM152
MKWVAIDGVFLFGLPALRIPWLEWSSWAMTALFLLHATLDAMMMFQIGIPILYWLELLFKTFYDRELAIAERRVKPADVVDHASLFLGKQVINILPEG